MQKRRLFHILNARARAAEHKRQEESDAKENELYNDPRRDHSDMRDLSRIYPLIEDDNGER